MPTKFSEQQWREVRNRFSHLVTGGMEPDEAAQRVSRELGGKPAAGTIMNRYRNAWQVPSTGSAGSGEERELRIRLQAAHDELNELRLELEKCEAERQTLQDELLQLHTEKARAEGAMEVLKEVVNMDVDLGPTNANGHPSI